MAEYESIHGTRVKYLTSDPTLDSSYEGQVWYNSTTGTNRALVSFDSFTSSTPLTTARSNIAGMGTQTAALAAAGSVPPYSSACELYNGSGWANTTSNNTARQTASSSGTSTAGLIAGGQASPGQGGYTNASEEFDGSSWTEGNNLNMTRAGLCGFGTQTAGVAAGGYGPPPSGTYQNATEEYDGTSWTAQNTFTTGAEALAGAGTQTAGLVFGGASAPNTTRTAEYDGTNWTAGGDLNTARHALAGDGIQTSAIAIGGNTGSYSGAAEKYDGTSWTTSPATLGTSRANLAASHTSSNNSTAVVFGGQAPSVTTATEEFTTSINGITAAAWASGGTLPSPGRQGYGVGTGTQTASIIAGGPPDSTQNQFYDGASWTNLASIPTGATNSQGFGDSEELLMAGGNTGAPYSALTYVYSRPGNSWTAVSSPGNINTARALGAGCGALSTAGIIAGGDVPSYTTATENWNGSSWTTVNALPTATGNGVGSCGTQTAGLIWSGQNPGDPTAEETYEWDGTNWTSGGNRLIGVRAVRGGAGTQTAALTFGGWLDPGGSVSTEGYDGTSWSTRPNMAGAAANNFQTGTQTAALRAGGTDGPGYTAVEEFTGETTVVTASTLTTS